MPVRTDPHRESDQPPQHNEVDSLTSDGRPAHQDDSSRPPTPQEPTPLPKLPLFVLSIVIFTEPVTSTILFPFVYFMVRAALLVVGPWTIKSALLNTIV